jgi:hypothetical protein
MASGNEYIAHKIHYIVIKVMYLFITICSCTKLDFCNNLIDKNVINNSHEINNVINNGNYINVSGDKFILSILSINNSYINHSSSNYSKIDYYKKIEKCYNNKKTSFVVILILNKTNFSNYIFITYFSKRYQDSFIKNYKSESLNIIRRGDYIEFTKYFDVSITKIYLYHENYKKKLAAIFTFIFMLITFGLGNNCYSLADQNTNIPLMDEFGTIHVNDIQEKKYDKVWYNITQFIYRLHPSTHKYNSDTCPICLCGWSAENIVVLPCYHKYHYDCLKQTQKQHSCPLCSKKHHIKF